MIEKDNLQAYEFIWNYFNLFQHFQMTYHSSSKKF